MHMHPYNLAPEVRFPLPQELRTAAKVRSPSPHYPRSGFPVHILEVYTT